MARRGGLTFDTGLRTVNVPCVVSGCREKATRIVSGENKRERIADSKRQAEKEAADGGARCLRHESPEQVPTLDRKHIEQTLVIVRRGKPWTNGETWAVPVDDLNGRGVTFEHGPGFRFYHDEFPVGTRIRFSIDVETVEEREAAVQEAEQ